MLSSILFVFLVVFAGISLTLLVYACVPFPILTPIFVMTFVSLRGKLYHTVYHHCHLEVSLSQMALCNLTVTSSKSGGVNTANVILPPCVRSLAPYSAQIVHTSKNNSTFQLTDLQYLRSIMFYFDLSLISVIKNTKYPVLQWLVFRRLIDGAMTWDLLTLVTHVHCVCES